MNCIFRYFDTAQIAGLTAGEPDWGVNVLNFGHSRYLPGQSYPHPAHPESHYFEWAAGRRLTEFQLVYIAGGEGVFEGETLPASPVRSGTAFLLFPGRWHRFRPASHTGWEEFWVGFEGPYADYLLQQECFDPETPLIPIGPDAELFRLFTTLLEVMSGEKHRFRPLSSCLVIQMLALVYASALSAHLPPTRRQRLVKQLKAALQENPAKPPAIPEWCREQGVSYVWLRKAFRQVTGIAPGQYLLRLKLEKARRLLLETPLPVSQIALSCGFQSEFYLSRIFRSRYGIPPGAFRKQGQIPSFGDSTPI